LGDYFLMVALVAAVLGFGGVAGAAVELAKLIFFVALVLFAISAAVGLLPAEAPRPDAPLPAVKRSAKPQARSQGRKRRTLRPRFSTTGCGAGPHEAVSAARRDDRDGATEGVEPAPTSARPGAVAVAASLLKLVDEIDETVRHGLLHEAVVHGPQMIADATLAWTVDSRFGRRLRRGAAAGVLVSTHQNSLPIPDHRAHL
jgi:uncharacterized membrane protein YtjA (UPF0391 family)